MFSWSKNSKNKIKIQIRKQTKIILTQKFDFSYNSFCINQIFESFWNLLDSNFCFDRMIKRGTNNTIGSMSNLLDIFILILNLKLSTCTIKLCLTLWQFCFRLLINRVFMLLLLCILLVTWTSSFFLMAAIVILVIHIFYFSKIQFFY